VAHLLRNGEQSLGGPGSLDGRQLAIDIGKMMKIVETCGNIHLKKNAEEAIFQTNPHIQLLGFA